jgi:hypothetical protein
MRKIRQLGVANSGRLFVVCEDGSLWTAGPFEIGPPEWVALEGPPEGDVFKKELTIEEVGEKLAETGRGLIVGKGKKT